MTEMKDMELVRDYCRNGSEEAFAILVRRHIGLVYSAAYRHVGTAAHADEITQAVFIIFARKAASLRPDTVLESWLYKTTRLASLSFLRGERRRQFREQEAYMQSTVDQNDDLWAWNQMSPLLDEAVSHLTEKDRAVVILRFFKEKNLKEVAALMDMSEAAAQSRTHRAVEKLRKYFSRRGIMLPVAVLTAAISAGSVHAAPALLEKSVMAAAFAKGATAGGSTLTTIKGALKFMAWSKAKTAAISAVIILLAGTTGTLAVKKITGRAPQVWRITGTAQVEIRSGKALLGPTLSDEELRKYEQQNQNKKDIMRVIATAQLVILTDGKRYRISIVSHGEGKLTNDANELTAEYGSDGLDTFIISHQYSHFNSTQDGIGGFAIPGNFPANMASPSIPSPVRAAWLAYCSSEYFNSASNHAGLKLWNEFSYMIPQFVTNELEYWSNSTFPETITGWSRNEISKNHTNSAAPVEPVELEQYPDGFKAYKFTASDLNTNADRPMPRQITLETYFPEAKSAPSTGEDTTLLGRTTFTADSIELVKGGFDPLPPVTVPDLPVFDKRFENIAGSFVVESHATPHGWPTRGSKAFEQASQEAEKIAKEHRAYIQAELKKKNP